MFVIMCTIDRVLYAPRFHASLSAPKISIAVLAGVATGVDLFRLMVAAIPSENMDALEFKKFVLEDREPLTAEVALFPLLAEASITADEFRLGVCSKRHIVKG